MTFWKTVWAVVIALMIYGFIDNPHLPSNPWTSMTWFVVMCGIVLVASGLLLVIVLKVDEAKAPARPSKEANLDKDTK